MLDALLNTLTSPLGMVALVVAAGVTLTLLTLTKGDDRPDPLAKLKEQATNVVSAERAALKRTTTNTALAKKLDRYKAFLEPANADEMGEDRLRMIQAGYHGRHAVRDYNAAKFIGGFGGLFLGLVIIFMMPESEEPSIFATTMPVMVPTLLGYYVPIFWVNKRRQERQTQITRGFPDALDMLLICTEAGQSMDQSINRVSRELKAGYPALAEEFETVSHEVKAGKDRLEVLRDMGIRCGNADIKSFVTVLVQSATYGTSVAEALRVYAGEMRDKRVMLAEEKANVLPTKLTLGTMMFTVPPLLIILIGPSVHGVVTMLASASFGP